MQRAGQNQFSGSNSERYDKGIHQKLTEIDRVQNLARIDEELITGKPAQWNLEHILLAQRARDQNKVEWKANGMIPIIRTAWQTASRMGVRSFIIYTA